ncbi:MAG: tetratricopeptide repeat protein, partial [Verrucomicrobia bacterium]|nr:tetratricopeptide repeat protein [Verrucomicrobiota bacterium]
GLKLQKFSTITTNNEQRTTNTNLLAVLSVKEGAVDFVNSFGSVQATAMTESSARNDARPTEPKRLQTLQVVRLTDSHEWALTTSPLTWPEAAERLALGGGWAGLRVRDFASAASTTNTIGGATNGEVRVVNVARQSPADTAGLQLGDVMLAINGQPVTTASQVEKAILIRPNAETTLSLRRGGEAKSVALTATNRPSLLPGPSLRPESRALVAKATRDLIESDVSQRQRSIEKLREGVFRGAAENNLGVILESEDALGPAIRSYGRAVYADAQVPLYHFNLGLALRKIGSFERASEELETAARLAPQSARVLQRLAEIQSLLGHDPEALALTEAAISADPRWHGNWELKAQILLKQHRLAEAREAALKAIELEPHCATAQSYLADVLQEQGQLTEAEARYRQALELEPFEATFHLNLGTVYNARQQLGSAEQAFRKAIELRPDFALAYRNLGNVLADGHQFAQATAALRKATELDANDAAAHTGLGMVFHERAQFDEAERYYRKAIELDPKDSAPHNNLGNIFREARGKLDEAEKFYRQAIVLSPDDGEPYLGLGMVELARGNLAEAERLARKALALSPESSSINNNLGEILRARGQLDEAEKRYRKALELDPDHLGAYGNLGILHAIRGQPAEAEKMFRALLSRVSDSQLSVKLPALVNLAKVCGDQGKLEEAEKFFRQALALSPNHPRVSMSLAFFLADHRLNLDEALKLARLGVQAEPVDADYLDTLGWVQFQRGELAEAETTLTKALLLAGKEPPASEIREHLKKVQEKKRTAPK